VALELEGTTLSIAVVVGKSGRDGTELAVTGHSSSIIGDSSGIGVLVLGTGLLGSSRCQHLAVLLCLGHGGLGSGLGVAELGLQGSSLGHGGALDLASLGSVGSSSALSSEGSSSVSLLLATDRYSLGLVHLRLAKGSIDIATVGKGEVLLAEILGHEERRGRGEVICWATIADSGHACVSVLCD